MSSYPSRDLGSHELWRRSLERSLHRRAIAPAARRQAARRKHSAVAVSAAMMAGPAAPFAVAANGSGSGSDVPAEGTSPSTGADAQANVLLQQGSTGPAVARLQARLGVTQDSVFGPETEAAVRAFQAAQGLPVDGVVGPATWAALFGAGTSGVAGGDSATATDRAGAELAVQRLGGDDGSGEPIVAFQANLDDVEQAAKEGGAEKIEEPAPAPDRSGSRSDEGEGDTKRKASGEDEPAENRNSGGGETQPVNDEGSGHTAACGGRLVNPLRGGKVTSGYGPRWGRMHEGVDISAPSGTAIRAAQCGVVTFAGWQSGYGNIVCIRHTSTFVTCYAHMSRFRVSVGSRVHAGQIIGFVGCTGSCTGPHLHFETRVNGRARDPMPYLRGRSRISGRSSARPAVQRRPSSRAAARTRPASRTRPAPAPVPATGTGGGAPQVSTAVQPPEEQWVAEQQAATAQPAEPVATAQPAQPVATAQPVEPQPTATAEAPAAVGGPETAPVQPQAEVAPVDDGSSDAGVEQGDASTEVAAGTGGATETGEASGTTEAGGTSGSGGTAESGSASGGAGASGSGGSTGTSPSQGTATAAGSGSSAGATAVASIPAQPAPSGGSESAAPAEGASTGTP